MVAGIHLVVNFTIIGLDICRAEEMVYTKEKTFLII